MIRQCLSTPSECESLHQFLEPPFYYNETGYQVVPGIGVYHRCFRNESVLLYAVYVFLNLCQASKQG